MGSGSIAGKGRRALGRRGDRVSEEVSRRRQVMGCAMLMFSLPLFCRYEDHLLAPGHPLSFLPPVCGRGGPCTLQGGLRGEQGPPARVPHRLHRPCGRGGAKRSPRLRGRVSLLTSRTSVNAFRDGPLCPLKSIYLALSSVFFWLSASIGLYASFRPFSSAFLGDD
jgi:hypothetical protein